MYFLFLPSRGGKEYYSYPYRASSYMPWQMNKAKREMFHSEFGEKIDLSVPHLNQFSFITNNI